jgi:hypothetical protein
MSSALFGCGRRFELDTVYLAIHFVLGDMKWSQTKKLLHRYRRPRLEL